ncbi:MAG TPA: hypothetical protein DGT23_10595 [Micromonosporaceae bacterium]|nr:hypothetical protein [Micromonosporaceae bacterium]
MRPKPLGVASAADPDTIIGLNVADARHHLHVLGPTGTGKSTFIVNYVIAEAKAGRGVAVIDPKGDLTRDLLERLPEGAGRRLVLIDPDETLAPAALNLLGLAADPEDTADQLTGVMARVWASTWGTRTDDVARHAIHTLVHLPDATLADLPRLLIDPALRKRAMRHVAKADTVYRAGLEAFWASWEMQTPGEIGRVAGPLLSKLRAVLSRRFAAQLFGTPRSTFALSDILNGGILLVRLPKLMGEDTVRLTGSLLVAALLYAAARRGSQPEHQRLDLGQLSKSTFEGIDANARNKIFFELAPGDAKHLVHHVAPYFEAPDLTRRDPFGIVAKLVINGRDSDPFTLITRPAPPAWPGRAEALRAAARTRGLSKQDRDRLTEGKRLGPSAESFSTFTGTNSEEGHIP